MSVTNAEGRERPRNFSSYTISTALLKIRLGRTAINIACARLLTMTHISWMCYCTYCRSIAISFLNVMQMARDILEDRVRCITEAIAALESDSEDTALPPKSTEDFLRPVIPSSRPQPHGILPLIVDHETHPSTSAASYFRAVTPSARTYTLDLTNDSEILPRSHKEETQLFDEDFIEDNATSSNPLSHESTLVDTPDHFAVPDKIIDDSAHAITTSVPQSPHLPVSDVADEFSVQQDVPQTISSDDELWNCVDDDGTDDNVEIVSPDANKPAPSFSAVAALRPPPAEAPSEASLKASPHYPEVVEKLRNVFRLKAFRKNQLAAIISTLDGRDAIVLMPTGGGKSLCYQLPAICRGGKTNGVTFVVTPLRALMADQVERLRDKGIDVMMFAFDSQDGNSMRELRNVANVPSLVYITPEKLWSSDGMKGILKDLHARRQLARFVIDEAHLINSWGRDFRSEGVRHLIYLEIRNQADRTFSTPPFMISEPNIRGSPSWHLLRPRLPRRCRISLPRSA